LIQLRQHATLLGVFMSYTISTQKLDDLLYSWRDLQHLDWNCLFTLPPWLRAWWCEFGDGIKPHIFTIQKDNKVMGIAPLLIKDGRACFIGSPDVCDYLDFVITPDMENYFFSRLLDELEKENVNYLELHCLRPDSTVVQGLIPVVKSRGYKFIIEQEATSVEIDLPGSWDEYLATLNTKQRHEIRRKLKRLLEAGNVDYRILSDWSLIEEHFDHFLEMFRTSREDKAGFMTARMETFFRRMARDMALAGLLRLGVLGLDGEDVAMLMFSEYRDVVYLYNSGYDPRYSSLSVGLLSKLYCLRGSIEEGKDKFDFMKGSEVYKYRLGGREVSISYCRITLN
jgi:CelD/BcsL family acetyltransferase involved in cellulose biosynthesis